MLKYGSFPRWATVLERLVFAAVPVLAPLVYFVSGLGLITGDSATRKQVE